MLDLSNETVWARLLEKDPTLKELAVKAGAENNPKRAKELMESFAFNGGYRVAKTDAEKNLALYLFCSDFEGTSLNDVYQGRLGAARRAGYTDL